MDVIIVLLAAEDGIGIVCHRAFRHQHIRILILFQLVDTDVIDGASLDRPAGIDHVILSHVPLTDDRYRSNHLIVPHTARGLDAHNIVRTLVADKLARGDVHQFDVLRHDHMGSHLFIDQNDMLGVIIGKVITVKLAPYIPHLHRVRIEAADLRSGRQA